MGGQTAENFGRSGYVRTDSFEAALPMPVWVVDMEIEQERTVTAAEVAVLRLVEGGIVDIASITGLLGLRSDFRLATDVLVAALAAGAAETANDGFALTQVGRARLANGQTRGRERVIHEIRLDPATDELEWVGAEREARLVEGLWTIDLPPASDDQLLERRHEVGKLVREEGLPDDGDEASMHKRPQVDLIALSVRARRIHWRPVRIDVWRHAEDHSVELIGHIADAEHPALTRLLQRCAMDARGRRLRV